MSRSGRIAIVAALGGVMLMVAIIAVLRPAAEPPVRPTTISNRPDPIRAELARCRTITGPDAGCEAAWAAHRRRFLGEAGR